MYKFVPKRALKAPVIITINGQVVERAIDCNVGDYVINQYGHIRSDFAILTDTNDSVELSKALMQMQQAYADNSSQFDGLTFEQMVKVVRPRWCQLPGEVDKFEQYLIDQSLDFYNKLRDSIALKDDDDDISHEKPATLAPAGDEANAS